MREVLRQIARNLRLLVGRGIVRLVNDAAALQEVQVELLSGELLTLERFQDYGITSVPLPGAEAVTVAVGGRRGKSVVVRADDRRYRVKLNPGEVALYTHDETLLALRVGGIVEIIAATKVKSQAPLWEHTGDFLLNGNMSATGQIVSAVMVGAPAISAAASLTVAGLEMVDHNHYYTWTDPAGNAYTYGPSAP